ncbi:MAG: antitoxin Xre-like helix-turn-helix domain-containing protein [Terriglobia bacterium]
MATLFQPLAGFSPGFTADLSLKQTQQRLSRRAVPAFFRLAQAWQVRDEAARQLLGGVSNGAFYQLKRGDKKTLDQDQLTRISLLLGIFKALNILYSRKLADAWVSLPNTNPMFEGDSPLAYMIRGGLPALIRVRQLLDARRGGR